MYLLIIEQHQRYSPIKICIKIKYPNKNVNFLFYCQLYSQYTHICIISCYCECEYSLHHYKSPSYHNKILNFRCKIADFGLARSLTQISDGSSSDTDPTLTDYVATRWYRAPEILIANRHYTKGIDLWSLGCILGEMLAEKPIFPGTSTVNQVERIMATIPVPSHEGRAVGLQDWWFISGLFSDIKMVCPSGVGSSMIKNACNATRVSMRSIVGPDVPSDALDLLNKLLIFNPMKRLTAEEALEHDYIER